jgi:hypothetical protein
MIFGIEAPKFIYDYSGANTTVLLDFVTIEKDEPEKKEIIHQSIFTGPREFVVQ